MNGENRPVKIDLQRALEDRFPYANVCTECGKVGCRSFWHALKHAMMRNSSELMPKHYFAIDLILLVLLLVAVIVYCVFGRS